VNPFENMDEEQLKEFLELLTYHAYCKLVHLRWRGLTLKKGGTVPGGVEAHDLATQAVVDVIDGTRAWDPSTHPDLLRHLKSVVDSKVSNLVNSSENKTTKRFARSVDGDRQPPEYEVKSREPNPFEVVANCDSMDKFRAAIVATIKDDPLALDVLKCLDADITKPSDMATVLGRTVDEINNAQKRLRNKVSKALKKMKGEEHERCRAVR
jgi:hypothetical protein